MKQPPAVASPAPAPKEVASVKAPEGTTQEAPAAANATLAEAVISTSTAAGAMTKEQKLEKARALAKAKALKIARERKEKK